MSGRGRTGWIRGRLVSSAALVLVLGPTVAALAGDANSLNFYGVPGTVDMPSAESLPDAELTTSYATFDGINRFALTFQFAPWASGTFRYSRIYNWDANGFDTYSDRAFDLRFRLLKEGKYVPAVTVGLQDFVGTGFSSAEYIVATKHIGSKLRATAGLGWGRFGSYGSIGSTGTREPYDFNSKGGSLNFGQYFRGPFAPFGSIQYDPTDKLTLKVEYSSDDYSQEVQNGLVEHDSPFNFGIEYAPSDTFRIGAYYLYGSTFGLSAQIALNPGKAPIPGTLAPAPLPVKPRDRAAAASWGTEWAQVPANHDAIREATAKALAKESMQLEAMTVTGNRAILRVRNPHFDAEPMAMGRIFRNLSYILPPSVEYMTIVPIVRGIPASGITISRTDLERLESVPNGTEESLARTVFSDFATGTPYGDVVPGMFPMFTWWFGPTAQFSFFDPDQPLLYQLNAELDANFEPTPGLIFTGVLRQRIVGNFQNSERPSNSTLPHVRSDALYYAQASGFSVPRLQMAYYFRPGPNLYGRVTAGYLETMFGGISGEILWKPVQSRLALGIEADYVAQRDFQGFGFQDYSVATGFVSAYYQFNHGYEASVHAGRYLAGDWGATLELGRMFANGWEISAFATKTNVSAEEFGEGSFDKGIQLTIPLSYIVSQPTRAQSSLTLRPITRDGGQQVYVDGRLYELVRDYHANNMSRKWGMFWR